MLDEQVEQIENARDMGQITDEEAERAIDDLMFKSNQHRIRVQKEQDELLSRGLGIKTLTEYLR